MNRNEIRKRLTKKVYIRKFKRSWLDENLFKGWLTENDNKAWYKICNISLVADIIYQDIPNQLLIEIM